MFSIVEMRENERSVSGMPERVTAEDEQRLREIAEAATPGTWEWYEEPSERGSDMGAFVTEDGERVCWFGDCEQYYPTDGEPPEDRDIAHIAAFDPPTALRLLDTLAALREEIEGLKDEIGAANSYSDALEEHVERVKRDRGEEPGDDGLCNGALHIRDMIRTVRAAYREVGPMSDEPQTWADTLDEWADECGREIDDPTVSRCRRIKTGPNAGTPECHDYRMFQMGRRSAYRKAAAMMRREETALRAAGCGGRE